MSNKNMRKHYVHLAILVIILGLFITWTVSQHHENGEDRILRGPIENVCYYTDIEECTRINHGSFDSTLVLYTDENIESVMDYDPSDSKYNNNYERLSSINQFMDWELQEDKNVVRTNQPDSDLYLSFVGVQSDLTDNSQLMLIPFYTVFPSIKSDHVTFSKIKLGHHDTIDIGRYHIRFVDQNQPLKVSTKNSNTTSLLRQSDYLMNTSSDTLTIKDIGFEFDDELNLDDYASFYKVSGNELSELDSSIPFTLKADEGILINKNENNESLLVSRTELFDLIYSKNIEITYEDEEGTEFKNYVNWKMNMGQVVPTYDYDQLIDHIEKK